MLKSYLLSGWRALLRWKLHFALNVAGLGIGLAATLLVAMYVQFELSYDRFQPDVSSTYRLAQIHKDLGEVKESLISVLAASLAVQRVAEQMPEVKSLFALFPVGDRKGTEVKIGADYYLLKDLFAATSNIRDFVRLNIIHGRLEPALARPDHIAISESQALRLFGTPNAVGKTMTHAFGTWTIAAVFEDLPANTHFSFASLVYMDPTRNPEQFWGFAYVRLADNTDLKALAEKIRTQINARSFEPWLIGLMPMKDIHLKSNDNQKTVNVCIALSLLLLGIASFNFINMSTAQAARRAKEVGVRKGIGATRGELVTQFLVESLLVASVAAVIATVLTYAALPWFKQLVNVRMSLDLFGLHGIGLLLITLIVGVLAGLYPALFISAFSARRVLSGDLQTGKTGIVVRNVLLGVQALFSVCLIIATLVVLQQIKHLNELPVGYAKTHRLEVRGLDPRSVFDPKNGGAIGELERIDGVLSAAPFDRALTDGPGSVMDIIYPNTPDIKNTAGFTSTGYNFIQTVGLQLIAGRDFLPEFPADWYHKDEQGVEHAGIVIPESMARSAGIETPADAVGQTFKLGINGQSNDFLVKVVGVVKDVTVGSVKQQQYPIFFICGYSWARESTIALHIDNGNLPQIRREVEQVVKKFFGVNIADLRLVEENYEAIYQYERRQAELVAAFALLAIFLTCIGLFGLAALSAQRRNKEVAIRKSLGASIGSLVNLLCRDYLLLVGVACIAAFPVAFYFTNDWLSNFNERVPQSWWIYLGAGVLTVAIAWLTISVLAFRAASVKPWSALRYD